MSLAMTIDMAGTPLAVTIDFSEFVVGVLGLDFSQAGNSGLLTVF